MILSQIRAPSHPFLLGWWGIILIGFQSLSRRDKPCGERDLGGAAIWLSILIHGGKPRGDEARILIKSCESAIAESAAFADEARAEPAEDPGPATQTIIKRTIESFPVIPGHGTEAGPEPERPNNKQMLTHKTAYNRLHQN
jgi:hypothetical protein